jgi:hypothetical protein
MKNKWIWITLSVIVVLVLIAGVGVLGYRAGFRNTNALTLQGDEASPYPRQLMPGMHYAPYGSLYARPTGFIGYFFLLPLRVLLGLAVLLLVVWLVVKVVKVAWDGSNHKPKPTEAKISSAPSEPVTPQAPVYPSEPKDGEM